ncbi:unnamed protein product [Cunninghamella blakesleeana]
MGLAGQKVVQRISSNPNNLNWSNDTSKFGFRMMAKMGWAPGKGLGVKEDGSQQHIKIRLKDDTLGLGAKKNNTDNWLGNTDAFSRLLADLTLVLLLQTKKKKKKKMMMIMIVNQKIKMIKKRERNVNQQVTMMMIKK